MKLLEFQVGHFRNVVDSTPITVEEDVTCLVGKNESGKTALLQALHRLKPAGESRFDVDEHYPRWLLVRDRKAGRVEAAVPIRAVFALGTEDRRVLEVTFGEGVVTQESVALSRLYDGRLIVELGVDESRALAALLERTEASPEVAARLGEREEFSQLEQELATWLKELEDGDNEELRVELEELRTTAQGVRGDEETFWDVVASAVISRLPVFFYFSDYSVLPGRIDLRELAGSEPPAISGLQTARALLELAGTDTSAIADEDYELRRAELEAVSNELTRQVFDYWTQNRELSVQIDVDKVTEAAAHGQRAVARYLDVRVLDRRHGYTNNFGQRSSGFQWFFSFLAAFSEFEEGDDNVIVLLDEPALTLHGRAQADFLRFIEERLAPNGQVIYTTHSPFMVEPGRLERARVVEDRGPDEGAVVSSEVLALERDSLFPLQAALGYDIAQNLFVGPNNLLVEGTSDYTYLTVLSEFLISQGRTGLDARWRVLPAGGAQNIPAFVALLGGHLEVTVLVDAGTQGMQRLQALAERGLLEQRRLVTVAEVTGTRHADIEDVFELADYLRLFAATFDRQVADDALPPGDRVVKRLAALDGTDFDHGVPADHLLRHRERLLPELSVATTERFERLFERLNATLDPPS